MSTRPLPAHGTLHRRKTHKCDCPACLRVDRDYTNTRTRLQAYGQWQPYVDAQPARAHTQTLMDQGIGWMRIARLAGVPNGGMSKLLYGDPQRGLAPCKRIRRETEQRILTVRYSLDHVADSARIDATGTRRRLQALVAIGWPQRQLARRAGLTNLTINKALRADVVEGHTARAVRDMYRHMSRSIPEASGVAERYATQARRIAATNNWHGPLAWDDIDDPAAQPEIEPDPAPTISTARDPHTALEVQHLASFGTSTREIARRVGRSESYVREQLAGRRGPGWRHRLDTAA